MTRDDAEEFDSVASKADVVWHPVRLRIMNALSPNRRLTATQIGALLPDVAVASLYRHLKTLVDADVVQLIETQTLRGTVEKHYALPEQETVLDLANAPPEELVRYFTTFASALLSSGRQFFGQPEAEKRRGGMYLRQCAVPDGQGIRILLRRTGEFIQSGVHESARTRPPPPHVLHRYFTRRGMRKGVAGSRW